MKRKPVKPHPNPGEAIRVKRPQRKHSKPFVYFKGSKLDAAKISHNSIVAALKKAGLDLPDKKLGRIAKNLKKEVNEIIAAAKPGERTWKDIDIDYIDGVYIPITAYRSPSHIPLTVSISPSGRVYIRQSILAHGIRHAKKTVGTFKALQAILKEGFETRNPRSANVLQGVRRHLIAAHEGRYKYNRKLVGDQYSIEMMAQKTVPPGEVFPNVREAAPGQIVRVNIGLVKGLSSEQIKERKQFYRQKLRGFPIYFKVHQKAG